MKRIFSVFLILMMSLTMLSACGETGVSGTPSATPSETAVQSATPAATAAATATEAPSDIKGTVEIVLPTGDFTNYVKQQLKRGKFNEQFPNIEVKISPEGSFEQIIARVTSNDLPSIYASPMGSSTTKIAGSGKLANYKEFAGSDELLSTIDPAYIKELNGGVYAVPLGATTQMMAINAALFKEAGLDPANPPKTFDEFLTAAQKISALPAREDGKPVYGFTAWNMALTWGGWYWGMMAQVYLNFNDGKYLLFNQDGTDIVFDKPESGFKNFVDFMAQAQQYCDPAADITKFYSDKNIGMTLQHGYGWKNNLKENNLVIGQDVVIAPIPSVNANGTHWSTLDGRNLLLFKKDAETDKAAWEVVKFLMREDVNLNICQGVGLLPVLTSAKDDPFFQQPGEIEFYEQAKNAVLLEGWKASDPLQNDLLTLYNQCVVEKSVTSDEMIAQLTAKAKEYLQDTGK